MNIIHNDIIRKTILAFGNLFSQIPIVHYKDDTEEGHANDADSDNGGTESDDGDDPGSPRFQGAIEMDTPRGTVRLEGNDTWREPMSIGSMDVVINGVRQGTVDSLGA